MNSEQSVTVWDIGVRFFHWGLVLSFVIAYATGDDGGRWHVYSGYCVLGLIVFRVLWGFIGTKYARFSDFVYPPVVVRAYVLELMSGKAKHYIGHNPAGGWMILAILICLVMVSLSGLKIYAIEEGKGPFASNFQGLNIVSVAHADSDDYDDYDDHDKDKKKHKRKRKGEHDFWEALHEAFVNLSLLLIFVHIAAVVVSGKLHDENLVKAMITGKKPGRTE